MMQQVTRTAVLLMVYMGAFVWSGFAVAAVSLLGTSSNDANANSLTLAVPGGVVQDDVLIAQIAVRGNRTVTPPAGWTLINRTVNGTKLTQAVYWLAATSPIVGSQTWTFDASDRTAGSISVYRGVNPIEPINNYSVRSNASSTNIVASSVTPTVSPSVLVGLYGVANGHATLTPAASMQETVDTIIPEDYGDEEEYWTQSLMDNDLNTLIENAFAVHEMNYFYDDFMLNVFGFLTLAITMLLLYFQWGSVISLVISIPITGVFFFIGALLYIMIRRPWEYDNTSNFPVELFVYLLLYGLVLLISILGVKRVWNSYVTNIALTISYFLSPLLLTMLTFFTHALFTTNVLLPCQEFPSRVEPFSLEYGWAPFVLIYSPYPLFWISLFLIKTIIAKKEA